MAGGRRILLLLLQLLFTQGLLTHGLRAPKIKPFHFSGELGEGLRTAVMCVVTDGDPPFDFEWYRDERPLTADRKGVSIRKIDEFTSFLTIEALDADSNGNYTCRVSNAQGHDHTSDTLSMRGLQIKPFHFPDNVRQGLRTAVMCVVVEGDPPFDFEWSRDGRLLTTDHKDVSLRKLDEFTSILTIDRLDADSNGNYTCRVSNAQGHDHKSGMLSMRGLQIKPFHFPDNVREGLRTAVMCVVVEGDPPFDFQWSRDGRLLTTDHKDVSIRKFDEFTSFLTIESLDADSNGNYTCRVSNAQGHDHKSDTLSMRGVRIKPFHFPDNVREGLRAAVMCGVVDGDPPFDFEWSRDGRPLTSDHKGISIRNFDEFTSILTIERLDADSNGNYTCRVSNAQGHDRKSDTLSMKMSPQWVQEPRDLSTMGGRPGHLDCVVRGHPKPGVQWRKKSEDGSEVEMTDSSRWRVSQNGSLLFKRIEKGDEGLYTCRASNGVGDGIAKSARLDVKAPPRISSASRLKIARKAESTSLACDAEGEQPLITSWAKNGVSLQTTGRVQLNEELSASGVVAQFTILSTHRSDGGSYTCSARNKFGEVNNTIVLRIVEPPERPVSVKVGEVWSRAATVSWSPPFDGNSPVTQYLVHYWKDIEGASHRLQERGVSSTQTSVLLGDLHPGTTYLLRVVAENEVGRGESSEPFKLRTEEEAPSAPPTDVTVIATGPTSVSVTWKAPPREHWNGRLLGFYVGHRRQGSLEPFAFHTVPAGRSPHADFRLQRLQKATRYSVLVKAFNSVGSGPESHELTVETSDKDSLQPPHLYVSETSDAAALLEWEHPRDLPDDVFTHYMVYYRPGAEGSWHSVHVPSKDRRFRLTSLESGTKYQVYLTAYSESGVSDPSDTLTLLTEGKALSPSSVGSGGSSGGDTPYFLKLHFIVPVAASVVIIVIVIVVAWVWVKKAQFRDEREAARVSLYAEAYYTLPPPQKGGGSAFFPPAAPSDDAYDVPWDLPPARTQQKQ